MKLRGVLIALCLFASTAHAEPAKRARLRHKRTQLTAEGSTEQIAEAKREAAQPKEAAVEPPPAAAPPEAEPPASPGHPDVKVTTKLDKRELKVGEVVKLLIDVDAPTTTEPSLPEQAFGGLELIDRHLKTQVQGDRTHTSYELDLLALEAGDANIPALSVKLVGANGELSSVQTDSQSLRVTSRLANEPNAEPKPPSGPLSVMQDDYTVAWVALAALAVALVAAATLLISRWLKRRPKPVAPPPPPRPPWELARERLEQLASSRERLFAEQKGEQFVAGVSDALREYLGRRYGFDGLERTTAELMTTLEKLRPHALQLAALSSLLDECDLVKFARFAPNAEQGLELWSGALAIVKSTTPSGTSLPPLPPAAESAR
jgi:hypothetical protein